MSDQKEIQQWRKLRAKCQTFLGAGLPVLIIGVSALRLCHYFKVPYAARVAIVSIVLLACVALFALNYYKAQLQKKIILAQLALSKKNPRFDDFEKQTIHQLQVKKEKIKNESFIMRNWIVILVYLFLIEGLYWVLQYPPPGERMLIPIAIICFIIFGLIDFSYRKNSFSKAENEILLHCEKEFV